MNSNIPQPILKALKHVRFNHPTVCMVVFNSDGQWQYMSDDFKSPVFGKEIIQSVIEAAADAVPQFPAVYQFTEPE